MGHDRLGTVVGPNPLAIAAYVLGVELEREGVS